MCQNCGCQEGLQRAIHVHHPHHHGSGHDDTQDGKNRRIVHLESSILAHNDAIAAQNRQWLSQRGIFAINMISSPGSGKTLLLERTLDQIKGKIPCAVIVGDVQTDHDARRLVGKGARVHQIETFHSCHLNAEQIGKVLPDLVQDGIRLLIIENVGNLVCPAAFDLGEHCKVALLSVTEGEDKPLKYPLLFSAAPVCLLTKMDLVPHLAWNEDQCCANLRKIRPDIEILKISALNGDGMDAWLHFLEHHAL